MPQGTNVEGKLDQLLGYQLRRASSAMMADFIAEMSAVPLRPVQYAILSLVGEQDGISQRDLCEALSVQKANMVPLIATLEQRGLISRRADARDRRIHLLTLTDKARDLLPKLRRMIAAHERRFLQILDQAERKELARLLRKLRSANTAMPDDPA